MFKSKKDFNEITTYLNFECVSVHPLDLARNLYQLLNTVYRYSDRYGDYYIKKSIDLNILKYLLDKLENNLSKIDNINYVLSTTKETYNEFYKSSSEVLVSTYAIPTNSFEVTLSELVIMYKSLDFCIEYFDELKEYILIPWDGRRYYYIMKQIQDYLISCLGHSLLA